MNRHELKENHDELNPIRVQYHHMQLLKQMNIRWSNIEFGAPSVSGKRPYGASVGIYDQMKEITGLSECEDEELERIHYQMLPILQIAVRNNGVEVGDEIAYTSGYKWELISDDE